MTPLYLAAARTMLDHAARGLDVSRDTGVLLVLSIAQRAIRVAEAALGEPSAIERFAVRLAVHRARGTKRPAHVAAAETREGGE